MSRAADALNRLELIAKKMEMSIEDALSILEGRHETHVVVQKYKQVEPVAETSTAPATTLNPTAPQIPAKTGFFKRQGGGVVIPADSEIAAANQAAAIAEIES